MIFALIKAIMFVNVTLHWQSLVLEQCDYAELNVVTVFEAMKASISKEKIIYSQPCDSQVI